MPKHSKSRRKAMADPNVYPDGWDYQRTRKVAAYYDRMKNKPVLEQSDELKSHDYIWMEVPTELMEKVQKLIAAKRKSA
jgi:hypothetical protein